MNHMKLSLVSVQSKFDTNLVKQRLSRPIFGDIPYKVFNLFLHGVQKGKLTMQARHTARSLTCVQATNWGVIKKTINQLTLISLCNPAKRY